MKAITYKGLYCPILRNNGVAVTVIITHDTDTEAKGSTQVLRYKDFTSRQRKMLARSVTHTDYKEVKNMMTGAIVKIPVDTPMSCDPSTETYWSM